MHDEVIKLCGEGWIPGLLGDLLSHCLLTGPHGLKGDTANCPTSG